MALVQKLTGFSRPAAMANEDGRASPPPPPPQGHPKPEPCDDYIITEITNRNNHEITDNDSTSVVTDEKEGSSSVGHVFDAQNNRDALQKAWGFDCICACRLHRFFLSSLDLSRATGAAGKFKSNSENREKYKNLWEYGQHQKLLHGGHFGRSYHFEFIGSSALAKIANSLTAFSKGVISPTAISPTLIPVALGTNVPGHVEIPICSRTGWVVTVPSSSRIFSPLSERSEERKDVVECSFSARTVDPLLHGHTDAENRTVNDNKSTIKNEGSPPPTTTHCCCEDREADERKEGEGDLTVERPPLQTYWLIETSLPDQTSTGAAAGTVNMRRRLVSETSNCGGTSELSWLLRFLR
nr:VQ motif-containing protein 20-like [Ipomoea batatas]